VNTPPTLDLEPTPDFEQRCIAVINQWASGDLPVETALEQITTLGKEAVREDHLANQGRTEHSLGYIHALTGGLTTSIHHYERARALFNQLDNKRRIAICDLNMGESYRYKGEFNRARALYEKAYDIFKELGDHELEGLTLGNKGQMLLSMGLLDDALDDLQAGYQLAQALPAGTRSRTPLLCEIHQGLALLHLQQGKLLAAWHEAKLAHETAAQTQLPFEKGIANRTVAEVLSVLETPPDNGFSHEPDDYYQAAIEAFREINAEGEMARTVFAQARSLAKRGRKMTAARKFQLAMTIFTRLGMVDDAAKAAEAQLEVL
jgi:tetratricopeptide (TPR) repeat protein